MHVTCISLGWGVGPCGGRVRRVPESWADCTEQDARAVINGRIVPFQMGKRRALKLFHYPFVIDKGSVNPQGGKCFRFFVFFLQCVQCVLFFFFPWPCIAFKIEEFIVPYCHFYDAVQGMLPTKHGCGHALVWYCSILLDRRCMKIPMAE